MQFEASGIYHIYNQGNNRQKIFFCDENYRFFLQKIRTHILPYADVLAYCLMPNHFHLMVEVREVALPATHRVTPPHEPGSHPVSNQRTLNSAIGILLRSYTRAINLQENRSGALFREATKAVCLNQPKPTKNWYQSEGITYLNVEIPEWQYVQTCFRYIHNNPVSAKLVDEAGKWPYSSAFEISTKNSNLISLEKLAQLNLLL